MSGSTIAIIPARAGSTRLPGKNARPMAGRPMICWTFDSALGAAGVDHVVVSTDDPIVADLAERAGVRAIARPAALAGADASVVDAIAHALEASPGAWEQVVLLQPTSPLRTAADVDQVIAARRTAGAPAALSTSRLPKPAAFYGRRAPNGAFGPAEEAVEALRIITGAVYVGRPAEVLAHGGFRMPGCVAVDLPPERGWDVDTAEEFAACEAALLARLA